MRKSGRVKILNGGERGYFVREMRSQIFSIGELSPITQNNEALF